MTTMFSRGDIVIKRIVELEVPFSAALSFLPDLRPEVLAEHRSWLVPKALTPDGQLIFCFQSYVVHTPRHTILIDSCIGNHKNRTAFPAMHMKSDETYMRALATAGLAVDDIDFVLCTHLHFDHVGWNTRLVNGRWLPTFPQARYLFGRQEFDHWVHLRKTGGYHNIEHLHDAIDPIVAAGLADYVGTDYRLTDEVSLFPTPGHTPGHVSVLISSRGEEAVITGDLMHHPIQLADPSRPANFDMDKAQGALTRQAFVERFANSKVRIIGSHFCDPSSGWIERHGHRWKLRTE